MYPRTFFLTLTLLFAGVGLATPLQAADPNLQVHSVETFWATPYQIRVKDCADKTCVSGKLYTSLPSAGRSLPGRIRTEVLDDGGHVVAVYYGEPLRMNRTRHSRNWRFEIPIAAMPEQAASLRVSYQK
jgi:hypothetical protein